MAPTEEQQEVIATQELVQNSGHRTYLVTYSNIDVKRFPRRLVFARAVVQAFGAQKM